MKMFRFQSKDIVSIGLGMSVGAWGGWYFAHNWLAVIVGLVCGCCGGTVAAIVTRILQRYSNRSEASKSH